MARSYTGSVLHVDLTTGKFVVENPSEDFYRLYGGGSGMGMAYILRDTPRGVDPFAPENILTMFTGIPTGLAIPGQARLVVNARSPLTAGIGDSQAGGFFPAALKFAGFDGIVIKGAANRPVYLYINDGKAELRDASHLWGKTTGEVDEILKAEYDDPKLEIMQIGPAGEKLVRFASIMNMCNRANGRTGMGAVMGSKNLKAVVVQGKRKIEAHDAQAITRLSREGTKNIPNIADVDGLGVMGTASVVGFQNMIGSFPSYNYRDGQFEQVNAISGETLTDTILKKRDTCFGCTIRCKRVVETEYKGRKVLPKYGGPEYETLATFGSYCGNADIHAIALANQLCNMYGLDTISCGATIAFAMECYEKGLISKVDTQGVELRFGNSDAMLAMIEKIANREGIGKILGEGSQRAAAQIGKNASDFLITTKGNEAPAHMPQAKRSLGVIYAVNPFGADHQSSEHDPMYEEGGSDLYYNRLSMIGLDKVQPAGSMNDEKVRFAYLTECFYSALDSYALCQFVWGPAWTLYGPAEMAELLRAATGWDVTIAEIMQVGERRLNMLRAFNTREGLDRSEDVLPRKFYTPLEGTGPTAGMTLDNNEMEHYKDIYYSLAGWDVETGNPTAQKLTDLELEWVSL